MILIRLDVVMELKVRWRDSKTILWIIDGAPAATNPGGATPSGVTLAAGHPRPPAPSLFITTLPPWRRRLTDRFRPNWFLPFLRLTLSLNNFVFVYWICFWVIFFNKGFRGISTEYLLVSTKKLGWNVKKNESRYQK